MIKFENSGDFKKTIEYLNHLTENKYLQSKLDRYGRTGVELLRSVTPVDTGETANSWDYRTSIGKGYASITWTNSNATDTGIPIVVLLQYGHGTRNGGYVEGRDFINPVMQPLFDEIAEDIWMEVKNQ